MVKRILILKIILKNLQKCLKLRQITSEYLKKYRGSKVWMVAKKNLGEARSTTSSETGSEDPQWSVWKLCPAKRN